MKISEQIIIPETEIKEVFIRAGGPGGQNINKVATAVQLEFNLSGTQALPTHTKLRLRRLAGKRVTAGGILLIKAKRYRTQEKNREDARRRFADLIRAALVNPKKRIRTSPSRKARQERIDSKKEAGKNKGLSEKSESWKRRLAVKKIVL